MQQALSFKRRTIEFDAEGVTLRGWLYIPTLQPAPYPAVVMTHGFGGVKELYLDRFAEIFASSGLAVLVYDHRNFGESDGTPRQEIDPYQQVRDYRHAVSFLEGLPEIDPKRIGIWGTSYSGGHVLTVAAVDKRVKCVVSQVPSISGYRTSLRRINLEMLPLILEQFHADRKARFAGKPPAHIPLVDNSAHPLSALPTAEAWNFFMGKEVEAWRKKNWRNEVTLRSSEMFIEYEPGIYLERISPTPLLMIVADQDDLTYTDEGLAAF
jgi:hypothetical protein